MPDDPAHKPKTPPHGAPRRMQSQTERDVSGLAAKAIRESAHHAIPVEVDEDITGRHEGDPDELAKKRAKRPTDERIGRVEVKQDKLSADVSEIKADVAEIKGSMTVVPELVGLLRSTLEGVGQREGAKLTATLRIGEAAATDQIEANKARRALWAATATKMLAGAGILATGILAAIQARGC